MARAVTAMKTQHFQRRTAGVVTLRQLQRGGAARISHADIRARFDQHAHDAAAAVDGRQMQRCIWQHIIGAAGQIRIGAGRQQQLDHLANAKHRRHEQCRSSHSVLQVGIRPSLEEQLGDGEVASAGCDHQCGGAGSISRIDGRARIQKSSDSPGFIGPGRYDKLGAGICRLARRGLSDRRRRRPQGRKQDNGAQ